MKHLTPKNLTVFITLIFTIIFASQAFAIQRNAIDKKKHIRATAAGIQNQTMQSVKIVKPDLEAKVLRVIPQPGGRILIIGKVKNIGDRDFICGPNQASAQVQVHLPHLSGARAWPILTDRKFTRLNKGTALQIRGTYTIEDFSRWAGTDLSAGECPVDLDISFIVQVSLDPDILSDSSRANDDADFSNNMDRKHCSDIRGVDSYVAECPY